MSLRPRTFLASSIGSLAAALCLFLGLAPAAGTAVAPLSLARATTPSFQTSQSNNWSGYSEGILGQSTVFQSVSGEWVVPTASYRAGGPSTEGSSSWVGIGGGCLETSCAVGDPSSLIQAGTEQDANSDGTTSYSAWWELVPAPSVTDTSVAVHPGDLMSVSIADLVPGVWTITLKDVTDGQGFTQTVPYPSTMLTAEWVEEAPVMVSTGAPLASGLSTLPNLSTAHFDAATVNGHPAALTAAEEIEMTDSSGTVIAVPSGPDADADGFDVCAYATSCPVPTSELP